MTSGGATVSPVYILATHFHSSLCIKVNTSLTCFDCFTRSNTIDPPLTSSSRHLKITNPHLDACFPAASALVFERLARPCGFSARPPAPLTLGRRLSACAFPSSACRSSCIAFLSPPQQRVARLSSPRRSPPPNPRLLFSRWSGRHLWRPCAQRLLFKIYQEKEKKKRTV